MIRLNEEEIQAIAALLDLDIANQLDPEIQKVLTTLKERLSAKGTIELYVDGAADLHTKTAGVGGVFYRNGEELYSFSEYLDGATNNEAEYTALLKGLEVAEKLKLGNIKIYADSELVVKQINGEYKVRNPRMQVLHAKVSSRLNQLQTWSLDHVPRNKNLRADALSKEGRMKGK